MSIRVVIADDHPTFRFGLRVVLDADADIDVVGEAADGAELVAVVRRERPDVVITDLSMPVADGADAATAMLAEVPTTRVLVLTMHADDGTVARALRAGAVGYLLKDADQAEIRSAVLAVAAGGSVYGDAVAQRLAAVFTQPAPTREPPLPTLTAREREIVAVVATGAGNHEVARRLLLSEKTVRNQVAIILTKLALPDRAALVAKARDAGLGAP